MIVGGNVYAFVRGGSTENLTVLHLPIALWLAVGIAYTGGHWFATGARMNFVRFSGELFIYYVLMGLGGGLLTFVTMTTFLAIGVKRGMVCRRGGCFRAVRLALSSSPRGSWRRGKTSSRTWRPF